MFLCVCVSVIDVGYCLNQSFSSRQSALCFPALSGASGSRRWRIWNRAGPQWMCHIPFFTQCHVCKQTRTHTHRCTHAHMLLCWLTPDLPPVSQTSFGDPPFLTLIVRWNQLNCSVTFLPPINCSCVPVRVSRSVVETQFVVIIIHLITFPHCSMTSL